MAGRRVALSTLPIRPAKMYLSYLSRLFDGKGLLLGSQFLDIPRFDVIPSLGVCLYREDATVHYPAERIVVNREEWGRGWAGEKATTPESLVNAIRVRH